MRVFWHFYEILSEISGNAAMPFLNHNKNITLISAQSIAVSRKEPYNFLQIKKMVVTKKMFALECSPDHAQDLAWTYKIFQVNEQSNGFYFKILYVP